MKKYIGLLILAVIAISCSSTNPALVKRIGDYFGRSGSGSYNSSGKFVKPMPYSVGQWVLHGVTNDGEKSVVRTSIVEKIGDGWVIESYSLNKSNESTTQMLIRGLENVADYNDIDDVEIVWVKMKDNDGNINNIDGAVLSITKGLYKKALASFNVNVHGMIDGGNVTVPAGTFNGTFKVNSEVSILGTKFDSESWHHTAVPINGLVKSVSKDNSTTMELLDFGTTGASKSF